MDMAVVGTGYVGLAAGICFAEAGNRVIGVDVDEQKIARLRRAELPIYEVGLQEMLEQNLAAGRLSFTSDLADAVRRSPVVFITVGTPPRHDGEADTAALEAVAADVARAMPEHRIVVIKSTVPVGTNRRLQPELAELTAVPFDLVSNPEFLKEGCAVDDFLRPDRVIIGTDSPHAAEVMAQLYSPFVRNGRPLIVMDPTSAEMAKYAANAMLSTKISFINEVANLCDLFGADVNDVRRGICSDSRIGYQFLYPGLGYGGSCFPKDVSALIHMSDRVGYPAQLLKAVKEVNSRQKQTLQKKIVDYFGEDLRDLNFAVWGAAFKPRTDDLRESPALRLIDDILSRSGGVRVHDPQALGNLREIFGDRVRYCGEMYEGLDGADALCLATDWNVYRNPDYRKMGQLMRRRVVFDGRNIYNARQLKDSGFTYFGIGTH
ncbi:MAG: UDP-glucose/GDP-mannose dehydrogenase family protein [Phycisphaerae bacterium]|nr:UDP-glucose/GDP-mannose dehydrogenase family protein [Phycisphaerae bacterium]